MQGGSLLYGVWQCTEIATFCRRSVPKRLTGFCAGTAYYLSDSAPIGAYGAFLQKLVTFDFGDQTFHFSEAEISPLLS
jgi:hypothetical protein